MSIKGRGRTRAVMNGQRVGIAVASQDTTGAPRSHKTGTCGICLLPALQSPGFGTSETQGQSPCLFFGLGFFITTRGDYPKFPRDPRKVPHSRNPWREDRKPAMVLFRPAGALAFGRANRGLRGNKRRCRSTPGQIPWPLRGEQRGMHWGHGSRGPPLDGHMGRPLGCAQSFWQAGRPCCRCC